ncbi:MAG: Lrp/AsnC family transcriptional regulator [Desulfurococcales archaeon]|nr:Lrp/AsnC family transcriptional regulator [Desulfurococcales archaeon]
MVRNIEVYERKALELIKSNRGILQSELWKRLGLDSREGSRIVLRLERKGMIKREGVIVNGRRTYKLYYVGSVEAKRVRVMIDLASILDLPCATCRFLPECGPEGVYSPYKCKLIEDWVLRGS